MRTTLDIDDDLLFAAKEMARRERKSAGKVVSELMRKGLTGHGDTGHGAEQQTEKAKRLAAYGLHPLPHRGVVVTNELVNKLRDELGI